MVHRSVLCAAALTLVLTACSHSATKPAPPVPSYGSFTVPGCPHAPCDGIGKVRWQHPIDVPLTVRQFALDVTYEVPNRGRPSQDWLFGSGDESHYVFGVGRMIDAVNARTGAEIWQLPDHAVPAGMTVRAMGVSGRAVELAFLADTRETNLIVDTDTGRVITSFQTAARDRLPTTDGLVWANDQLAVLLVDSHLRGLDLTTGRVIWSRAVPGLSDRLRVGYAAGSIDYLGPRGVQRVDTLTGKPLAALPSPDSSHPNDLKTAADRVYLQTATHAAAVDGATGKVLWNVPNRGDLTVDPFNGTAYLWNDNDKILGQKLRIQPLHGPGAMTVGDTVKCGPWHGISYYCHVGTNSQERVTTVDASTGKPGWASPILPYFTDIPSLSTVPTPAAFSYLAGLSCAHASKSQGTDVSCTKPRLVAINR